MPNTISPTAYRNLARIERHAADRYRRAREAALVAGAAHRADRSGRNLLAREDALGAALEARFWLFDIRRRIACAAVVPFGGRLSPAAAARRAAKVKP